MNACSLPLGGKLAGLSAPKLRGAVVAAVCSAALWLPAMFLPSLSPLALMGLPLSIWICWGGRGLQSCLRCGVTTLCASLLTGGAASALMSAGLTPMTALLGAAGVSMLLYALAALLPSVFQEVRQVELRVGENRVLLPAMLDSGNLLRDPVTALPVLVAPCKGVRRLFPQAESLLDISKLPLGFRLLSVRTAAGGGLMPMFRPDGCRLYLPGCVCDAEVLVVIAGSDYRGVQALVPLSALPRV